MRNLLIFISLFLAFRLPAQDVSPPLAQTTSNELREALVGAWVGTLEYRDYSEPATSTKRVKLPTWLKVESSGDDLRFKYVYDDGPSKIVKEVALIGIDISKALYTVRDSTGKTDETYAITGLAQLRAGRGTLTLNGKGTENDVPVDVRTTLRIGRNILEITRETVAAGQSFGFRHAYTFVRAVEPVDSAQVK